MQHFQYQFYDIVREYKGHEESKKITENTLYFWFWLSLGFLILYLSFKQIFTKHKIKITIGVIAFFAACGLYRTIGFINYDSNKIIDKYNSSKWVSGYESGAVFFSTPEGMDYVLKKEDEIIKKYEDENIKVIFAESIYNNLSKKSDVNAESAIEIFQKQISDIFDQYNTKIEVNKNVKYGSVTEIILISKISEIDFGKMYVLERNTDITFITIFYNNSKNSLNAFKEFDDGLKFNLE